MAKFEDMGKPSDEFTLIPAVYDVPPSEWGSVPMPFGSALTDLIEDLPAAGERANRRRRMHYKEYLESEEWATISRLVRRRDQNRCRLCGAADEVLEVHHLTCERRGFEELTDLVTLCHPCHMAEHKRLRLQESS